jgi:hypothetical protein
VNPVHDPRVATFVERAEWFFEQFDAHRAALAALKSRLVPAQGRTVPPGALNWT